MAQRTGKHRKSVGKGAAARAIPRLSKEKPLAPPPARGLTLVAAGAILAAVCLVAYWNSFRAELVWDNQPILLQDPRLQAIDWQSLRNIFTENYWWPSFESDLFRPLTTLSYWFNYSVLGNGTGAFGYHVVNLLLHWLNVVLVFVLVRGVTNRPWVSLFTAAVLATHPLAVESVTNVIGRADLLAGLSIVGGVCLYRGFLRAEPGRRLPWLIGLGATYLAGVFCKESAVVLPGLMLLHDAVFPAAGGTGRLAGIRRGAARVWPAYLSVLPGLAALLWARWAMFHASPMPGQFASDNLLAIAGFWTRIMTAVKVLGYDLALVVWPAKLSCDYSYHQITLFGWSFGTGQDAHAWIALAAVVGLLAVAIAWWRRRPAVAFFLGLAAIALLPTANLLFPIGTIMAERFMYVPLVGLTAAAALSVTDGVQRWLSARPDRTRRTWVTAGTLAAAIGIAAFAGRTIARNEDWTSAYRLWSSAVWATPDNYKAYKGLAAAIMESDPSGSRVDEAIETARRGLRIVEEAPLPLYHMPSALYSDLGWYYIRKAEQLTAAGHASEAQAALDQTVTLLTRAEEIDREINRRGRERLMALGRRPEEIHDVGNPIIYRNLGSAYLLRGHPDQAIAPLSYMQRILPGNADSHYARGLAEASTAQVEQERGNARQAAEHLELAAVNLVAATILNPADERSWRILTSVYEQFATAPSAVLVVDGRRTLNMNNPLVSRHVREACAQLVRQMQEAGLSGDADAWRARMIQDFHVPPDVFGSSAARPIPR